MISGQGHLASALMAEAECPRKGQEKRPAVRGVGLHVLAFLRAEFPSPATPRTIAKMSGQSYEAVKKWLQRNDGVWVVKTAPGGWYRARADPKLLARIGLQPLKVHGIQARLSLNGGRPPWIEGHRDKDGNTVAEFLGRRLTAQPMADGGLFISLRASKEPLSVEEFGQFTAYLYGVAGGGSVRLTSCDLNVDTDDHLLRLRGVESVELGDFHGATVKLYNKRVIEATRLETCFHRLDLGMAEAAQILHGMTARPEDPPAPAFFGPTSGWREHDFI